MILVMISTLLANKYVCHSSHLGPFEVEFINFYPFHYPKNSKKRKIINLSERELINGNFTSEVEKIRLILKLT